jgi:quinol monooxygenase YgiN
VLPGNEDAAKAALIELSDQVEAEEPFTEMYFINTAVVDGSSPPPPPTEIVFLGSWPDRAAFDKHLNGPVFQSWSAKYASLFLTDDSGGLYVSAEFIDQFTGFIRPAASG